MRDRRTRDKAGQPDGAVTPRAAVVPGPASREAPAVAADGSDESDGATRPADRTGLDDICGLALPGVAGGGTVRLPEPGLHFVATPIGAARDITLRALDVLAGADVLAAEDTRTLRRLMDIHGVPLRGRPLIAYHDHNGEAVRPRLLAALAEGRSVAYASEAGTPLVADPGFGLCRDAIAAGARVFSAPGPCAVLAALTVSGLPSDRFLFAGFAPPAKSARLRFLGELSAIPATVILYESPKRIQGLLSDLVQSFGIERMAAVCRELTKRFEEVSRGTLGELVAAFADRPVRGEIVVVLDRRRGSDPEPHDLRAALRNALPGRSVRDAADEVAAALGLPRRVVYRAALALAEEEEG